MTVNVKFHINYKGEPGKCTAKAGRCPYGGESEHYSSVEKARAQFEKDMESNIFVKSLRDSSIKNEAVKEKQEKLKSAKLEREKVSNGLDKLLYEQSSVLKVQDKINSFYNKAKEIDENAKNAFFHEALEQ